jgi:hypothetical protein
MAAPDPMETLANAAQYANMPLGEVMSNWMNGQIGDPVRLVEEFIAFIVPVIRDMWMDMYPIDDLFEDDDGSFYRF